MLSIMGAGPHTMFAVGSAGTVLFGNGVGWAPIPVPATGLLSDVSLIRNASDGGFGDADPANPRRDDAELEVVSYRILWEE